MKKDEKVLMQDVSIGFRNFSGLKKQWNDEGKRNFCIFLEPEQAEAMLRDGWNIKYLKVHEEGDVPQAYVQVAVNYDKKPPKVFMLTSKNKNPLDESMVHILDHVDIKMVDVILNPYSWTANGNEGVKAYLDTLYIIIEENYLDLKYEDWGNPHAIERGPSYDLIEGELA